MELPEKLKYRQPVNQNAIDLLQEMTGRLKTTFHHLINQLDTGYQEVSTTKRCAEGFINIQDYHESKDNVMSNDQRLLKDTSVQAHFENHGLCYYDAAKKNAQGDFESIHIRNASIYDFLRHVTPHYQAMKFRDNNTVVGLYTLPTQPRVGNEQKIKQIIDWFSRQKFNHSDKFQYPHRYLDRIYETLIEVADKPDFLISVLEMNNIAFYYEKMLEVLQRAVLDTAWGAEALSLKERKSRTVHPEDKRFPVLLPQQMKNMATFQEHFPDSFYADSLYFDRAESDLNIYIVGIDVETHFETALHATQLEKNTGRDGT